MSEKVVASSFWFHYAGTSVRAFEGGWNWIIGQGVLAGLLLALCILAAEGLIVLTARRASGETPNAWWKRYGWPTIRATICGAIIFVLIIFSVFFIRDPVDQANSANNLIASWQHAWEQQAIADKDQLNIYQEQISRLNNHIKSLSEPDFAITIKMIITGYTTPKISTTFHLFVIVSNSGASASLLATTWHLTIKLPNGRILEGEPVTLPPEGRKLCLADSQHSMIIERSDDLSLRAARPIERNDYREGILGFWFPGEHKEDIVFNGVELIISAKDIYNHEYRGSETIGDNKNNFTTAFLSSLAHPELAQGCP